MGLSLDVRKMKIICYNLLSFCISLYNNYMYVFVSDCFEYIRHDTPLCEALSMGEVLVLTAGFVRSFVRSFIRSFVRSFVRSLVRLFVCLAFFPLENIKYNKTCFIIKTMLSIEEN